MHELFFLQKILSALSVFTLQKNGRQIASIIRRVISVHMYLLNYKHCLQYNNCKQ